MYPAKNGDAFLIKSGSTDPRTMLIDAGYASTFKRYILPDLKELAEHGRRLDCAIATHIDADHVTGLLALLKANGGAQSSKIIGVDHVLHNSLRSLSFPQCGQGRLSPGDEDLLQEIHHLGYPSQDTDEGGDQEISARAGSSLAALLLGGRYRWNTQNGILRIDSAGLPSFKIGESARITVIGPRVGRLEALKNWWLAEIRRLGFGGKIGADGMFDDAFEFLCARENLRPAAVSEPISHTTRIDRTLEEAYAADDSVVNGSSISLIVEMDSTRLLFLGDARAEDIEAALRLIGNSSFPIIFDAIKISHHGSLHNTSPALLALMDAPRFFVSSNGHRHGHPDIEVLKAIVDRPATFHRELYFNYKTPASQLIARYASKSRADFSIHENATDWIQIETLR